jgi:eukaryotic-like serine/threonine-protein kinase
MPNLSEEQWRAFSDYLDRALELPETERAAWLADLASTHPEIAAEIEQALAVRERKEYAEFLSNSPVPSAPIAGATLIGRRVGPYLIESEIGRGGMGSVWRARRADGRFEGTVAIKFVHAYWLGRDGEGRFRSEGRMLGRLDHPNIARLVDAGVIDDSQPYLVLEYVEGEPIDAYCDRLELGLEARVALFQGVLAAVGHAHSHLIIHRDLKPANVFVTREGTVKLLDFGIAKLLTKDGDAALTQTSTQALTPQYAAPEQLLGRPVTTATDVYALGLVLYVLLTGVHPLGSGARATPELLHAVLKEEAPRPSMVASGPISRRRALEGDLDTILGKALKKDPAERYASVVAFAEDLRRFLSHEPISARPDTVPYRVAKFVRRNRGSVVSGLLVAIGLIVTSAFALSQMQAARAQRDRALEEAKRANAQADLTQYILDDKLSRLSPDAESQRLDRSRQFLAARFRNDPLLAARLLIDVSGRYIDIGDFRTAADVAVEAETVAHRFDDADILGQLACIRTEDLAIARDFTAARAQLAQGLAQMRRLDPVPPGIEAECATAEAFVVQAEGDFARAVDHLRATVADLDQAGMHGASRYLATSNDLSRALAMAGQYREAWEISNRNVALMTEMGRPDTGAYLAYVNGVCSALRNGGQPTKAVAYIDAGTAKVRHDAGYADMSYASQSCWALSRLDRGEPQQAEPAILEAASKAEQGGVTYSASLLRASAVIAALARADLATAETRWADLLPDEVRRLAANEKGIEVVRLLLVNARLDMARHRPDEALKSLDRAGALIASRRQRINPDARELEALRSSALIEERRYVEAEQHAQAALELARISAVDPKSSSWIGEALVLRARAEVGSGRKTASATAQEALTHLVANLDPTHPLIAQARAIASGVAPQLVTVSPPVR